MKKVMKYEAPKCPSCKKELTRVDEEVYEAYQFNEKTGSYQGDIMSGELRVKCFHCGEDVSELFEEGACNYQSERNKK